MLSPQESQKAYKSFMKGVEGISNDNLATYLTRQILNKEMVRNVFKNNRRSFGGNE